MKRRYQYLWRCLAEAVNTTIALLQTIGVPRQVVMDDGLETLLEVYTFRETVGANEHMGILTGKVINLYLSFFVSQSAGHDTDSNLLVFLFLGQMLSYVFAYIFSCLYILAENNGIHTAIEGETHNLQCLPYFFITVCGFDVIECLDKITELTLVGVVNPFQCFGHYIIISEEVFQRFVEGIYFFFCIVSVLG